MSTTTWLMMVSILGFTWGGFIVLLAYGVIRDGRRQRDGRATPPTQHSPSAPDARR